MFVALLCSAAVETAQYSRETLEYNCSTTQNLDRNHLFGACAHYSSLTIYF